MNDVKKILIIKGSSQYDAARCFCDELQAAFCNMGCLVTMLDLTTFPDINCPNLFAQYDMIFSFDVAGIELYNTMETKPLFWTFLIDPPIYLNERLKQINGNVMVSCIDKRHVMYIDKYYNNIPWTCFMPHGGVTGEIPVLIPYYRRKYEAVILGSLQKLDMINTVVASLKNDYDPLVSSIIDASLQDPKADLNDLVRSILDQTDAGFDDMMFREFMYIIRGIDALRRYHKRYSLVKGLIENGISVDIWGSGWEQLTDEYGNSDRIRLHGEVSYNEAKYIIHDSKILINDMPPYYEGSHERVFTGMQCGTIVATDRSTYFEECFKDNTDLIFYDTEHTDTLASSISELLSNPEKAHNMIVNAQSLGDYHTWKNRAASILEICEMLTKTPSSIPSHG